MTKIAVVSDLHYYSPELGISGRAYELKSGSDQKCLAQSGAIIDSALERLSHSNIEALLIAGDITNDGERCSHSEIYERLSRFDLKIPVYLITSTHDWCSDKNPRRYEGSETFHDVPFVTPEELSELYLCFGEKTETARYRNKKGFYSRVFQLGEGLRLLAVNDDCDGKNGASGYSKEHLEWAVAQIKKAREDNCDIIAMEHHLLLHGISPLVNSSQSIADNIHTADVLADAGLRLIITGHSHMHRVTEHISPSGNRITQLNIGALCGYPAPVTFIEAKKGRVHIKTEFLTEFTYNGEKCDSDFIKNHTTAVFTNLLNAAINDRNDLDARLRADGIKFGALNTFYPLIKAGAGKIQTLTVGGFGGLINTFTLGKGIDKELLSTVRDERLLPIVLDIFLSVFDGSEIMKSRGVEIKRLITQTAALPHRAVKHLPLKKAKKEKILKITSEITSTARELIYPSLPDNKECEIDL